MKGRKSYRRKIIGLSENSQQPDERKLGVRAGNAKNCESINSLMDREKLKEKNSLADKIESGRGQGNSRKVTGK